MKDIEFCRLMNKPLGVIACVILVIMYSDVEAFAQVAKWMSIGSFQHQYIDAGGEPGIGNNVNVGSQWPAIVRHSDNNRHKNFFVGARDFTDEDGNFFPAKVSIVAWWNNYGINVDVFPIEHKLVSRFEPPKIFVDGLESFDKPAFVDEIDPSIEADRIIRNVVNNRVGVTMERIVHAFSQEYHDNYHIVEYIFTNTGNVDASPEIELPDQTITDFRTLQLNRYTLNRLSGNVVPGGVSWGRNVMNDVIGFGPQDYEVDFGARTGFYSWHGFWPQFEFGNNIGVPLMSDAYSLVAEGDSLGRLATAHFVGKLVLDVHGPDGVYNPDLNGMLDYVADEDWADPGIDQYNVPGMLLHYDMMSQGRTLPSHADVVEPPQPGVTWRERFANQTNSPDLGSVGGQSMVEGYGPIDLGPGETFRYVVVEAAAGLSMDATIEIGKAYKQLYREGNPDAPIEYEVDGEVHSMSKNEWVMTSRDSLFQTFQRAIANYESGYDIPAPPLPPREFRVDSGTDQIFLAWDTFPEADQVGFEIWRSTRLEGTVEPYELVASLPADARSYEDGDVVRGRAYYYYLQAIGDPSENDGRALTPPGVALKSGRYYTQTYDPAFLKREPGGSLADMRIVPNPFNLGSASDVRWPEQQDRIGFLDVPGNAIIEIYTQIGELIETIEHRDGSGDAYWDITTSSRQVVVSGVYLAIVRDDDTGEEIIKKFVIIR